MGGASEFFQDSFVVAPSVLQNGKNYHTVRDHSPPATVKALKFGAPVKIGGAPKLAPCTGTCVMKSVPVFTELAAENIEIYVQQHWPRRLLYRYCGPPRALKALHA